MPPDSNCDQPCGFFDHADTSGRIRERSGQRTPISLVHSSRSLSPAPHSRLPRYRAHAADRRTLSSWQDSLMAFVSTLSLLLWLLLTLLSCKQTVCLWPMPRSLQAGSIALKLSDAFDITMNIKNPPSDLSDAITRTISYVKNDQLGRLVVGRGASDKSLLQDANTLPSLKLSLDPAHGTVRSISAEATVDISSRIEGYSLAIPDNGAPATLVANSTLGLFRGLTTFSQLWYETGGEIYTLEAPMQINDLPAYPYRGFMLDTARNFFPVADIKRTLDAMSWVKLNMFHWHVVDSQSFPLQVSQFPELSEEGAYSSDAVYTTTDVQDIVSYASARGIDVLLEIDTPGHTTAIAASHPEHIACNQASPWADFASEPPAGQLRVASPATTNFTASIISSVAQSLPSTMFNTGGDELNQNCYDLDAETQSDLKNSGRTFEQALNVFTQALHAELFKQGKTPVVSEDMILQHNLTFSNETIVKVWRASANAVAVAAKNFRIIHAPSDYFYLDCGAGEWIGDDPTGNSWCDPFKTWQKSYTFDPLANLTDAQSHLILGGQQPLWTEQSSPENLDSITWPRAASAAEVFWSGPTLSDGSPRNVSSALPRLHDLRFRMVQRGINAIPLQPQWCALRPGACDLNS